jgi:hypothetical protein
MIIKVNEHLLLERGPPILEYYNTIIGYEIQITQGLKNMA